MYEKFTQCIKYNAYYFTLLLSSTVLCTTLEHNELQISKSNAFGHFITFHPIPMTIVDR